MPTINDTDLLVVNRGGKDYSITAADIYNYVNNAPPPGDGKYPWRDHEGGIFHVIITDPAAIGLAAVSHIVDLADEMEVDEITHAGEFIILTKLDAAGAFANSPGNWVFGDLTDTSQVTGMASLFQQSPLFNSDISMFDTSNVTNMREMFWEARAFNSDINNWDFSNVTTMSRMFATTTAFNQDISGWDVSNVTSMEGMFDSTTAFNSDISNWDVSNVMDMVTMFNKAAAFNQDLTGWCVTKIPSKPFKFAPNLPDSKCPKWGTCP